MKKLVTIFLFVMLAGISPPAYSKDDAITIAIFIAADIYKEEFNQDESGDSTILSRQYVIKCTIGNAGDKTLSFDRQEMDIDADGSNSEIGVSDIGTDPTVPRRLYTIQPGKSRAFFLISNSSGHDSTGEFLNRVGDRKLTLSTALYKGNEKISSTYYAEIPRFDALPRVINHIDVVDEEKGIPELSTSRMKEVEVKKASWISEMIERVVK